MSVLVEVLELAKIGYLCDFRSQNAFALDTPPQPVFAVAGGVSHA